MIGTKTKQSTDKSQSPSANGVRESGDTCVVASGTVIEGKFTASENVRLDGFIKGDFKCSQRLVIGENGRIEGKVQAKDAIVMGTIEGEVVVDGTLHLKGAALIKGTIHSKLMVVEEGARYMGDVKVGV